VGEKVKYFIGFQEQNGDIIMLPAYIISSAEYDKPNRLNSIVTFTHRFASVEELIPHLITDSFVPNEKKLGIYKKELNKETGLEETAELRWGLPFSDTIPFFQVDLIQKYFKEYIPNPEFLDAIIMFFKKRFGLKKPIPEGLMYSEEQAFIGDNTPKGGAAYGDLLDYKRFLDTKVEYELIKANFKKIKAQTDKKSTLIGDCRVALDKMIKIMLYDKPFEVGEEPIDYEAFYDLAMFVYNYEQTHQLEASKQIVEPVANRLPYRVPRRRQYSESADSDVTKLF
jgi:hypothetical protein